MKLLDPTSWLEETRHRFENGTPINKLMEAYAHYYHSTITGSSPTTKDYDHVNLILADADKVGLKEEVEMTAQNYLNEEPGMGMITAYTYAYNDWVK